MACVKKNLKHVKIIENTCSQFILWVTVDSDVIGYEFIIGAVYLPCVTSMGQATVTHGTCFSVCHDSGDNCFNIIRKTLVFHRDSTF